MEGIYTQLDWLTVMFHDKSFNDILSWLKLDPDLYVSDFLKNQRDQSNGFNVRKCFSYEGVTLECNIFDYLGDASFDTFDLKFKTIRLDLSGHGLEFLRSLDVYDGISVDTFLREYDLYPRPFNLTRCDFSFDLVNYMPTFIDELISYCQTNLTPNGNVCLLHMTGGVKCSVRTGDQRTVYLGSTSSKRLLRIYDKRLQYIDRTTGTYTKENKYDNPSSWYRIELQCRREEAMKLAFGLSDERYKSASDDVNYWVSLFRYIYDTYCFVDYVGTNRNNRKPAEFWAKLFDWEKIPTIIQNQNCVQFVSYAERVKKDFECNIGRMLRWFAVWSKGKDRSSIQALINAYFCKMFDYDDPTSARHRNGFTHQLNVLLTSNSIDIADSVESCDFGFYRDCGILGFKF